MPQVREIELNVVRKPDEHWTPLVLEVRAGLGLYGTRAAESIAIIHGL